MQKPIDSVPVSFKSQIRQDTEYSIVIQPTRGRVGLQLDELWEYRDLLYFLVWRDLKSRYRQTALGPLWIVLQPLVNMVLYTLVFGVVAKLPSDGLPYPVFSYVALLPWGFFADAFNSGTTSLSGSKDLISKVYFPRLLIPISKILSSLVDLSIEFIILIGMLVYYGIRPTWGIIFIPLFLLIAAITGLGTGLWLAGPIVRYRDFGQLAGYLIRIWMYATPVVYSLTTILKILPAPLQTLYFLNPMVGVVEGFRWALLGTSALPIWVFVISTVIFVVVLFGGLYRFKRAERSIVDVI